MLPEVRLALRNLVLQHLAEVPDLLSSLLVLGAAGGGSLDLSPETLQAHNVFVLLVVGQDIERPDLRWLVELVLIRTERLLTAGLLLGWALCALALARHLALCGIHDRGKQGRRIMLSNMCAGSRKRSVEVDRWS